MAEDNKELMVTIPLYEYRMLLDAQIRNGNIPMMQNEINNRFNNLERLLHDVLNKK